MTNQRPRCQSVNTTCPYCGVGCGVTSTSNSIGNFTIDGDINHPANFGKLCSKGYALPDTLHGDNRLLSPRINGKNSTWREAITAIATKFQDILNTHGPEAIAFYVSGQLLTEDYYVVNKFVKGYLGTANIDTNSRLCMASSVAGHKRAFGSDTVPGCYEDLESANLVVLVGSNLAWCHPVLFQRIEAAKRRNPSLKTIAIDPRESATAQQCDIHLKIKPGGECDAVLFSGLLNYLVNQHALDNDWIKENTNNIEDAVLSCTQWTPGAIASFTGLPVEQIQSFYALFLKTEKVVTVYSQGVNQSHCGTDTVNSITNVHLATGRIGKAGAGPFSITGQPNAMGGREVGGLANMLTCHMDIENENHRSLVQHFWQSPTIAQKPGLKAVDLFKAVGTGEVKALWVMATNPADSMPLANDVADAIKNCEFTVVSEVSSHTDTSDLANIQLPARAWAEKDGTVTNSERRISRQRAFKTSPEHSRSDWWAVAHVAKAMGWASAFSYQSPADIFREYATLSGENNYGTRDFDISLFEDIDDTQYNDLSPVQWPCTKTNPQGTKRLFANGGFFTKDRKAKFIPINVGQSATSTAGKANINSAHPLLLNTGRIRDQWHTMTRTGYSPKLMSHTGEPFVEINPADAQKLQIKDATLTSVSSEFGTIQLRALITSRVTVGSVFVPMHWNKQFASNARVNVLVHNVTDPVSGQPALKNQYVQLKPCNYASHAFVLTTTKPSALTYDYWASIPVENGWKTEIASKLPPSELYHSINGALTIEPPAEPNTEEPLVYHDAPHHDFRSASFNATQLVQAVFVHKEPVHVARQVSANLLNHAIDKFTDRVMVLSGQGLLDMPDTGATICSCMNVGSKTIESAIQAGNLTIDDVGKACNAGTQCGSCRADISRMIMANKNAALTAGSVSE